MNLLDATSGPPALKGEISRLQLFALGFGSVVGSAWVVILSQWLGAGPGTAVMGFLAGGLVLLAVAACYAELTSQIPATGGEFIFALHVYGPRTAFFVGWFIALSWICLTVFEGLALILFLGHLLPHLGDVVAYHAFGAAVTRNQLVAGFAGALLIARVNFCGGNAAARFQGILTYGFLFLALIVMGDMLLHGRMANLQPLVLNRPGNPWIFEAASVFATCAFLMTGFQAVSQAVEERSAEIPLKSVARIMIGSLAAGVLFYALSVVAAAAAAPWPRLAHVDLAIVLAAATLPGGQFLSNALLVAGAASLIKTWNAVFLVSARILVALGRQRMLPIWIARLHPQTGAPTRAVLVVSALNMLGLLLGRGAISVMVDTSATSVVFCFVLCSVAVPILRRRRPGAAPYRVPGGPWIVALAIGGSTLMAAAALVTPFTRERGIPVEYILLSGWAIMGAGFWVWARRRAGHVILKPAVLNHRAKGT